MFLVNAVAKEENKQEGSVICVDGADSPNTLSKSFKHLLPRIRDFLSHVQHEVVVNLEPSVRPKNRHAMEEWIHRQIN